MENFLLKIYYSYSFGKEYFSGFLKNLGKILQGERIVFGLNYRKGEYFYSLSIDSKSLKSFESEFYNYFNSFQIDSVGKDYLNFQSDKTVIGEIYLKNNYFFPFEIDKKDNTDFINSLFRVFENLNVNYDNVSYFVDVSNIETEKSSFYIKSKIYFFLFKFFLKIKSLKYVLNVKGDKNWREEGYKYYETKLKEELFRTKIYIVVESKTKQNSTAILNSLFKKFSVFKNYPSNEFELKINENFDSGFLINGTYGDSMNFSSQEIGAIFSFPNNPKNESGLLKVSSKKLAIPIGLPTFDFTINEDREILPNNIPKDVNILGISDFRSINVPIGIYDEDRLKHTYVIGKTGVGKSKFLTSLVINDIKNGKGLAIVDPHGDMIEEVLNFIPESRFNDVIIFDPTDKNFPFCINPLSVSKDESRQILARGFIDVFKKFFGTNWNPKLEHVLRMTFLALLDKKDSTLYDIIMALTDKNFRYEMINEIQDDVVKNFWTNEFASWSQQFNTEAIMPILNKVGQILSIEVLKNIFTSKENKLDFRKVMDENKILLVKLPKGKLQEEIIGFIGSMFVTKIYQASMSRQNIDRKKRTPFFLYVDEFQNFATDTFGEILSEARKYSLGLIVAHQFIKQVPNNIKEALFGNVGIMVSFRLSSEDSLYVKQYFDPFLDSYDLANLNQRNFYCKTLLKGQVKDPLSMKSLYVPDLENDKNKIDKLYSLTRSRYSRTILEAKKETGEKKEKSNILNFREPLI